MVPGSCEQELLGEQTNLSQGLCPGWGWRGWGVAEASLPSSFLPEAMPDFRGTMFGKDLIPLAHTIHPH